MLDQIIFTRCSKHRDITNHGIEAMQDGFAVYSMSESLFSNYDIKDIDFISDRIKLPNASSEQGKQGLISSYEYYILPSGKKMISKIQGRPFCKERRKNGSSHRSGTYINQTYIGDFEGYMFEKFSSSDWNADQKSETEYYHDEQGEVVPYLNSLNRDISGTKVLIEYIKDFILDGRQEIYKSALQFLIHEFSKEESDRKVLLIKDSPENVEMWIAGFSLALSKSLASQLTFSTNKTRLSMQTDMQLFYYTDSHGKIYPGRGQNSNLTRHPYCMIVGFHPLDSYSNSVKQFPNSNYIILDGVQKQIGFSEHSKEIYYFCASEMDNDIRYFCDVILNSYSVQVISERIPRLFAVYKYLFSKSANPNKWEYDKTYESLLLLNDFGQPQDIKIADELFTNIINIYEKNFQDDERNGYKLLMMLRGYAIILGKEKYIENIMIDKFSSGILSIDSGDEIVDLWKSIQTEEMQHFHKNILGNIFKADNLLMYANKIQNASAEAANTVLKMYLYMIDLEHFSYQEIILERTKTSYRFFYQLVKQIRLNSKYLGDLINRISNYTQLLANLTYNIVLGNKDAEVFLDTLLGQYAQIYDLIDTILGYDNINFDVIDEIYQRFILVQKTCTQEMLSMYYKAYDKIKPSNNDGSGIFNVWLEVLNPDGIGMFCRGVYISHMAMSKKRDLFMQVDNLLSFDEILKISSENMNIIMQVAQALDVYSRAVELHRLHDMLDKNNSTQRMSKIMAEFAKVNVLFRDAELNSKYMRDIRNRISIQMDEEIHFLFITLFVFEDSVLMEQYVKAYIKTALENVKKNDILAQIVSLCQALNVNNEWFLDKKRVEGARDILYKQLVPGILPFFKSSFIEQMKKSSYDSATKKDVLAILQEVDENIPKGLSGFLNNLVGKIKK